MLHLNWKIKSHHSKNRPFVHNKIKRKKRTKKQKQNSMVKFRHVIPRQEKKDEDKVEGFV